MKRFIVLFITVILLCMCACGTDDIDISGYSDAEIVFEGISDEPVYITVKQLKSMDCHTVKTKSTSDKIGVVKATGVWLSDILSEYELEQADFSCITVYGTDEYSAPLYSDFLKENRIMRAFGIDGQPLDEDSAPVRIIIPESDSAYWTRMVNRIKFEK